MYNTGMSKNCHQCGICCRLFLINLDKTEYKSGRYQTMFEEFGINENFSEAQRYGMNILLQNKDESCIYLKNNSCRIHEDRPAVCRRFFCHSKSLKFAKMRAMIDRRRIE
jgi:Fe-S-cluster containining protein